MSNVQVQIDTGIGVMCFDRPTSKATAADWPGAMFLRAAAELERIAADIRRMYPEGRHG